MSENEVVAAYTALAAFQGEVPPIPKTKEALVQHKQGGGSHRFKYADLADVLSTALPIASKHGLALHQVTEMTPNGNLVLRTEIVHKEGGRIPGGIMPCGPATAPMQTIGANLTYARRYAACVALGLASDEDTDAQFTQGGDPDRWRREPDGPPPRTNKAAPALPARRSDPPAKRGPQPPPPEAPDPLPQERDHFPGDEIDEGVEITLTAEQRADEDAFLMELDLVESREQADTIWKRWKPRFQETMSDELVRSMHDHLKAAVRRVQGG